MFIGHFALEFAAKKLPARTSLAVLIGAALWPVWSSLRGRGGSTGIGWRWRNAKLSTGDWFSYSEARTTKLAMHDYDWTERFRQSYNKAVDAYRAGGRDAGKMFQSAELAFLANIGCSAQEAYDFAEDWCVDGEPSFGTALLITAARRDYFIVEQGGQPSWRMMSMEDFPAKDAVVAGYAWLPRLIAKARAKLRGEMPPELMYGCGGDRAFLKKVNVHPADFLRVVWWAKDDDSAIIEYVERQAAQLVEST